MFHQEISLEVSHQTVVFPTLVWVIGQPQRIFLHVLALLCVFCTSHLSDRVPES